MTRKHINLCLNCQHLAVYSEDDIKNSNIAGTKYDNGEEWMECGMGRWELIEVDKRLECPNEFGRARCSDYQAKTVDDSEVEIPIEV